jgi:hypothetical protein
MPDPSRELVGELLFPLRPFLANKLLKELTILVTSFIGEASCFIDKTNDAELGSGSNDNFCVSRKK